MIVSNLLMLQGGWSSSVGCAHGCCACSHRPPVQRAHPGTLCDPAVPEAAQHLPVVTLHPCPAQGALAGPPGCCLLPCTQHSLSFMASASGCALRAAILAGPGTTAGLNCRPGQQDVHSQGCCFIQACLCMIQAALGLQAFLEKARRAAQPCASDLASNLSHSSRSRHGLVEQPRSCQIPLSAQRCSWPSNNAHACDEPSGLQADSIAADCLFLRCVCKVACARCPSCRDRKCYYRRCSFPASAKVLRLY